MSGSMVRALLEDRKTHTRRIIPEIGQGWEFTGELGKIVSTHPDKGKFGAFIRRDSVLHGKYEYDIVPCKYGAPGDQLWVKETHQAHPIYGYPVFRADYKDDNNPVRDEGWPWRPSIFMPRRWSRITLEITNIRVERVQDITEEDALAEGIFYDKQMRGFVSDADGRSFHSGSAKRAYENLWSAINGPESWGENPRVWVLVLRKVAAIDGGDTVPKEEVLRAEGILKGSILEEDIELNFRRAASPGLLASPVETPKDWREPERTISH